MGAGHMLIPETAFPFVPSISSIAFSLETTARIANQLLQHLLPTTAIGRCIASCAFGIAVYDVWQRVLAPMPSGCPSPLAPWWLPRILQESITAIQYLRHAKEHADYFDAIFSRIGADNFCLKIPGSPWVFATRDPSTFQHVQNTRFGDVYAKGFNFGNLFHDLLGKGVFNTDGTEWLWQRKLAVNMFSKSSFHEIWYLAFINGSEKLSQVLQKAEVNRESVDMFAWFNRCTLDAISEIGFGEHFRTLDLEASQVHPFLNSFDKAQRLIEKRVFYPFFKMRKLLGHCWETELALHVAEMRCFTREVVIEKAEKIRHLAAEAEAKGEDIEEYVMKSVGRNFLTLFMSALFSSKKDKYSIPDYVTLDNVEFWVDIVLNFLIAGRDTTAQGLAWTLYELLRHPQCIETILAEMKHAGLSLSSSPLTHDDFETIDARLPYLQAVWLEGLRLHPPIGRNAKTSLACDTMPCGAHIPHGIFILLHVYLLNRNPKVWGADADEFRPERWLDGKGRVAMGPTWEYNTFNGGPRLCIGMRMAHLEAKTCLATLLARFKFECAIDLGRVTYTESMTLGMTPGLPVYVTARK